ncbi:MAG: hypothetical protein K6E93_00480 [Bacteroidales bacterium]|nr:hypothetical protein [Bacteroidales bacterium]
MMNTEVIKRTSTLAAILTATKATSTTMNIITGIITNTITARPSRCSSR